jgi:hypothetical protein
MATRLRGGVLTFLVATVLVACGQAGVGPAASLPPSPSLSLRVTTSPPRETAAVTSSPTNAACRLLTPIDVGLVLGVIVSAGIASGPTACTFTYTDPANSRNGVVATITTNLDAPSIASGCTLPSNPNKGITITPALGVGDDRACYTDQRGLGINLTFTKLGQGYEIAVVALRDLISSYPIAATEAIEKTLALEMLADLERT